jgi:MFS family permease
MSKFLAVLRQRNFGMLWTGQLISGLGDSLFRIALAWEVLLLTGSALAMGVIYFASLVPTLIFSLFGGVAADRLPRRQILLWSDAVRACLVGVVALLAWLHWLHFWQLAGLSLCFGIANSFFMPAYQAILPELVESEHLPTANALTRLTSQISQIVGPPIGALCIIFLGGPGGAFGLDMISFFVSVLSLLALRLPETAPVALSSALSPSLVKETLRDIREGLGYVRTQRWLWITIVAAALTNVSLVVPLTVGLPKLVAMVYGAGAWLLGMLVSADAVGAIVAAIVVAYLPQRMRRGTLAYSALLLSCAGLTVLGLPFPPAMVVVGATSASFASGFGIGVFELLWMGFLQGRVPGEKLGRVFSIDMLGCLLLIPIGLLIVGELGDHIGPAPVFVGSGLISMTLVAMTLAIPDVRKIA